MLAVSLTGEQTHARTRTPIRARYHAIVQTE
jgi:hypothetical protein